MYNSCKENEILRLFSVNIRNRLKYILQNADRLQEIRMRINKPMIIRYDNREYFVDERTGRLSTKCEPYIVKKNEMKETMEYVCNYSLYAFQEELRQGFITVQGGHRVGIAGKVVTEDGMIQNIKYISSINVRIAHEIGGCSNRIMRYITNDGRMLNTIIISPPGCGKTTLLRDTIRNLSDGYDNMTGVNVGVVDERSELAACYMGVAQNNMGYRTDILDCCPKAKGMMMLIRTMSPQIIAVDEIGGSDDENAIRYAAICGCKIIATAHGASYEELITRDEGRMYEDIFERFIFLGNGTNVGEIKEITDKEGNRLW